MESVKATFIDLMAMCNPTFYKYS